MCTDEVQANHKHHTQSRPNAHMCPRLSTPREAWTYMAAASVRVPGGLRHQCKQSGLRSCHRDWDRKQSRTGAPTGSAPSPSLRPRRHLPQPRLTDANGETAEGRSRGTKGLFLRGGGGSGGGGGVILFPEKLWETSG